MHRKKVSIFCFILNSIQPSSLPPFTVVILFRDSQRKYAKLKNTENLLQMRWMCGANWKSFHQCDARLKSAWGFSWQIHEEHNLSRTSGTVVYDESYSFTPNLFSDGIQFQFNEIEMRNEVLLFIAICSLDDNDWKWSF